jgi:hypothetical protein
VGTLHCPCYDPNPCHPTPLGRPLRHPCLTPSYEFKPVPLGPARTSVIVRVTSAAWIRTARNRSTQSLPGAPSSPNAQEHNDLLLMSSWIPFPSTSIPPCGQDSRLEFSPTSIDKNSDDSTVIIWGPQFSFSLVTFF